MVITYTKTSLVDKSTGQHSITNTTLILITMNAVCSCAQEFVIIMLLEMEINLEGTRINIHIIYSWTHAHFWRISGKIDLSTDRPQFEEM